MEIKEITSLLKIWAKRYLCILDVYIYGSRARNDFRADSDLDIAISIEANSIDENALLIFMDNSEKWKKELETLIPLEVHLELYNENTNIIKKALEHSSRHIYQKK